MSEDEVFVLAVSVIGAIAMWRRWYGASLSVRDFGRGTPSRVLAWTVPAICLAMLFALLRSWSAHDVRDSPQYLAMYLCAGAGWLGLVMQGAGLIGLSFRDDWLERHNVGAAAAGSGLLLGASAAYGGANIGDGPGWPVVLVCAALATGALFAGWWLVGECCDLGERVTVGRELGAGLRLGGYLICAGIIAGRSVAGNWVDYPSAFADFEARAWPLLPYTAGILAVERLGRRFEFLTPAILTAGCLAADAGAVAVYLSWAGPWT